MADGEHGTEIDRRLLREADADDKKTIVTQAEIPLLAGPIVILGDPGLGKSVLAQALGRQRGLTYVRAASFVRHANPQQLIAAGERIVIDGLDEIASSVVGGGIDAVLTQLSKMAFPDFILSSREVDWRGATDRIKIEDDYGARATVLHLQPFDRAEAEQFLASSFAAIDPEMVLNHLAHRGLEDISKNPLTLRLIGEIAASEETLPATRAQLLDRACRVLVREDNPRHQDAAHVHATADALLLAAGAYAAVQLLCDVAGVFTGPAGQTPDGYIQVGQIGGLPHAAQADAVLRTRLFEAEGERRFHLLHRVLAEYLGAKWLAACFRGGVSERRIMGLFGHGAGVPTSLRGLHAWIAHFDGALALRCIDADPYAVLRYGDSEALTNSQARRLLAALARLSDRDPYFRAEDWGKHPAPGLMRIELKDDILAIIETPEQHTHLTMLLIEGMAGTEVGAAVRPELTAMMFDTARYYAERNRASDALQSIGALEDPADIIGRLIVLGDEDSRRLAWEVAHDIGIERLPMRLLVECIFAHIGLTVSDFDPEEDRLDLAHLNDSDVDQLSIEQLCELLDLIRDYAEPFFDLTETPKHSVRAQVNDLVVVAMRRALVLQPDMPASEVWRRIGWISSSDGYKREAAAALSKWIEDRPQLRADIHAHIFLGDPAKDVRDGLFELYRSILGFSLSSHDIVALIEEDERRRGAGAAPDLARLEELVLLDRRGSTGASVEVRAVAARIAADSPEFLAKLDEWGNPIVHDWEAEQDAARAKQSAKRQSIYQEIRERISALSGKVRAGAPNPLHQSAEVYLGRYSEFDREAPPEDRVKAPLDVELAEEVLLGFMASLERNDLPSALEIAESRANDKYFYAEIVMVCGAAERLRRGLGLEDLPLPAREAAGMAWRRCAESNIVGGVNVKPLEQSVLSDADGVERFFRTSIEPQLSRNRAHIQDLYKLDNEQEWSALAGKLSIEWLRRFPLLPAEAEAGLLACAERHGLTHELRSLAHERRAEVHRDYEMLLAWLSIDFLVDFDAQRAELEEAANEDREFLWFVRNRIGRDRADTHHRLSIDQNRSIVEWFGEAWPKTGRRQGTSSGDQNPWDATEAIERAIYALGNDPSREATSALEYLIAIGGSSTYLDPLRHALELQLRARRDAEFAPHSVGALAAIATGQLPSSVDDMRAFFADRLQDLRERMHHTNTDMWQVYWNGGTPHVENYCRDRLIEQTSNQLPEAIRFEPEMDMPIDKRADVVALLGSIGLPVEIKRQWHSNMWTAPVDQLAARYIHEWHAEGRGAYIVIWFGDVHGQIIPAHPKGLPRPKSADELRTMLIDLLPQAYQDVIDIHVIDVSRPRGR